MTLDAILLTFPAFVPVQIDTVCNAISLPGSLSAHCWTKLGDNKAVGEVASCDQQSLQWGLTLK